MAIADEHYLSQYRSLHAKQMYGVSSVKYKDAVLVAILETGANTVLDYGCGQSKLMDLIDEEARVTVHRYDPSIPLYSEIPVNDVDLLINTDVLEHIPESDLPDVVGHMAKLTDKVFYIISTRMAHEILPSGENAHITIKPPEWWLEFIGGYFKDATLVHVKPMDYCLILTWKPKVPGLYGDQIRPQMGKPRSTWVRFRDSVRRSLGLIK